MMIVKNQIRNLTRKIVIGVTIGGAPLLAVGCAAPREAPPVVTAPQMTEKEQVAQVLASRDPQAVDAFLVAHPTSRYSVSLLNALPASVLVQISRTTIAGLPPETTRHLTRKTRSTLARSINQGDGAAVPAVEQMQPAGESSPFTNGGNSSSNGGARSGY